jgi:exopolyphosphatase/pppGpp-phosphohydrolase
MQELSMSEQIAPIRAAIDIGSNTIHIVVARSLSDDLNIIADEQEVVRIGASVTATGAISPEKREEALTTLCRYKALAEQHTSEPVLVVATEAIRQANNNAEFLAAVKERTGLEVMIVDGDVEATLTFYGATYELLKEPGPPAQIGVMDLGGGSMELVTAQDMRITWRASFPIGSGWLHDRYLPADPPTRDDLHVALTFLHTYLQGINVRQRPPALIVTGGSANSLLHLVRRAFGLEEDVWRLTHDDLLRCEGLLSALTAEEVSQRYGQPLARTRILPAGALIVRAMMERLRLDEIRVSPHGIREGVLLARARYGEDWLSQVQRRAAPGKRGRKAQKGGEQEESFIDSGRRLLTERTQKMLEWRAAVLKDEDIENVHKMRVASRRLRAVLDAYESACDQKQFKKTYRQVKKIADMLGQVRDTDVTNVHLQQQLEQVAEDERAGVQWLIARLAEYRQQRQESLKTFLQELDEDALLDQVRSCLHTEEQA